jgi:hypothetical protein
VKEVKEVNEVKESKASFLRSEDTKVIGEKQKRKAREKGKSEKPQGSQTRPALHVLQADNHFERP